MSPNLANYQIINIIVAETDTKEEMILKKDSQMDVAREVLENLENIPFILELNE